jgi:hypothetical protein
MSIGRGEGSHLPHLPPFQTYPKYQTLPTTETHLPHSLSLCEGNSTLYFEILVFVKPRRIACIAMEKVD